MPLSVFSNCSLIEFANVVLPLPFAPIRTTLELVKPIALSK